MHYIYLATLNVVFHHFQERVCPEQRGGNAHKQPRTSGALAPPAGKGK